MSSSLPRFEKFSAIIFLNKLCDPFSLSSLSRTLNILIFTPLMESYKSHRLSYLFFILCSFLTGLFQNSYPLTHLFCLPFVLLYCRCSLLHFSLHSLSSLAAEFLLGSFFFLINLFIYFYFWLRWVFIAARGLSLVALSGGYSLLRCTGFSLRQFLLLRSTGSRCAGFSSCGSWAQ